VQLHEAVFASAAPATENVFGWPVIAASLSLIAVVLLVSWRMGLRIDRSITWAVVRAAVQLTAVGFLLAAILRSSLPALWAWVWVAGMITIATGVMIRRLPEGPRTGIPAGAAVVLSTGISIAVVFGFGVFDFEPITLVVVAGITLGNVLPTGVLAAVQTTTLVRDRPGQIEALLASGFDRLAIIRFLAPEAARLALIPQVERTKVVGLIALPGAMTGLLLAGVDPIDAVLIQLLVMYLVLGSAAVAVVVMVLTVARSAVTPRLQLAAWANPRG
jgi:putative ABC transport system permease protein